MKEKDLTPEVEPLDTFSPKPDNRADSIVGMLQVVSTAPTDEPKNALDQIRIYTNGATYRLYWYDHVNHVWHYVTATA